MLGYQELKEENRAIIREFLDNCIIVDLNQAIKLITIDLKQKYRLKLPDAIIAATSIYMNLPLISADKDFERIQDIQFVRYEI
ncbi:PIN domain-containing protein [Neolewinella lacunae]|uniref:PIN domain-containing protein n=1 Tax=Neolewinella lacunae TaxID=1517758 RepID=UPI0038738DAA